jgi:excinuclease UvrABC nuclease subunit
VPESAGTYQLFDKNGAVLFVGSAGEGRLRQTLMSHLERRDVPEVSTFTYKLHYSESAANRERDDLIATHMPRYNS